MKRPLAAAGLVLVAAALAATAGIALDRLSPAAPARITLTSATPGSLEARGIVLSTMPVPPDCGLPVHVSRCPISKARAEAAANGTVTVVLPAAGGGPGNRPAAMKVVEAVLADAYVPASETPSRQPFRGPAWVVATDANFIAAMCPRPLPATDGRPVAFICAPGKRLVFVDPYTAAISLSIARP